MSKEKSTPTPIVGPAGPMTIHVELDPVVRLRELPVVPAEAVVRVPPEWKPVPLNTKQGYYKPDDDQQSELKDAMKELIKRRDHLVPDFGRHAPDVRIAERVLAQWDDIETGRARARTLLAYYEDKHDLLLHDGMSLVIKANRQIQNLAKDEPTIVDNYPKTITIRAQRSDAIREGMAQARRNEKDQTPEPPAPIPPDKTVSPE